MLTKDNNLNIRQFKLLNGEEIIALVNEKDDFNYIIERPYKVNAGMVGGFYFVPWFPFSSQKLFKLSREKIVYHAELDEDMKQEYVKLASEFLKPRPKPTRLKSSDDIVDSIFITDTIDMSHINNCEKLKTISSAKIFAETINRIHSGESVSQLFRKVT